MGVHNGGYKNILLYVRGMRACCREGRNRGSASTLTTPATRNDAIKDSNNSRDSKDSKDSNDGNHNAMIVRVVRILRRSHTLFRDLDRFGFIEP